MHRETLRWVLLQTAPWGHRMRLPGWHLARHLVARGNPVAYVSAPVSPWHFLSGTGRELAAKRWSQDGARGRWRHPNLFTYIPRTLAPIHRQAPWDSDVAWSLSHALTMPNAAGVLRNAGFANPDVVLLQCPLLAGLAMKLAGKTLVVSVEDALEHFDGMPRVAVRRFPEMIARANLTTVTAERLESWARERGAREVLRVPNGVDFERFRRPRELPPRPAEFAKIRGPIAVYVGALDEWFDDALLARAAKLLPQWTFAIIGPARRRFAALEGARNVRFLGQRAPDTVPPYLWHANAGVIPFKRTPLIESVLPLKLFEYAAAGLSVVSTRWSEMESVKSPARLVADGEAFARALLEARMHDESAELEAFARSYSWDRIFAPLVERVSELASK